MADNEKQLTLNVTTKHQAAVKGLTAVGGSLQSIGAQAKKAQKDLKNITGYKNLVKQTAEAKAAWKDAEQQVKSLAAEIKKSDEPTKKQVAEFNRAVKVSGQLKEKYSSSHVALAALRKQLTSAGIDTKSLSAEQTRLGTAFDQAKQKAIAATKIDLARGILDVDNPRKVKQEIDRLQAAYKRLETAERKGVISSAELAQAKRNLKSKIDELHGSSSKLFKINKLRLAQLGGLASGFYGVGRAVKALVGATAAGETSTYLLESAVEAANRQFEVGSMEDWGKRIKELSGDLRIYSQTELETATAKTIEMTKRLGLSADQMQRVIEVSANLSTGKTDLAGGIERVTAALRGEAESSEYLGLTLNETYVKSWYKANTEHAKAWKSLSDLEKAQVRYLVLLDQASGTEGRAADSIKTLSGAWQYMQARMNDAIRNNQDLREAIGEVTQVISKHAGTIVHLISMLVSAAGKTAEWILQNKALAATIVGGLAAYKAFGGSLSVILGIMTSMKAAGVPDILSGASGRISAGLMARIGLYGALAATLLATAKAAYDWYQAEQEANQAMQRSITSAQQLTEKVKEYKDALIPQQETVFTANAEQLIELRKQLYGAYAYWMAQETELSAQLAKEKSKWFFVDDELVAKLEQQLSEAREKMIAYHQSWRDVEQQIKATGAAATQSAADQAEAMGDVAALAKTLATAQKDWASQQVLLNRAIADSKQIIINAKTEVFNAADAYWEAARALAGMTEGEEGYAEQLAKVDRLKKEFVVKDSQYKEALWQAEKKRLEREEQAFQNSYERRKIQLEKQLQDGIISRDEYAYQVIKAEAEMQAEIIQLRQKAVEKSSEILGKDTEQYKQAVQEKIDAELDLQRIKNENQEALDDLTESGNSGPRRGRGRSGEGSSGFGSRDSLSQAERDAIDGVYRKAERKGNETQQEASDRYERERKAAEEKLKQEQQSGTTSSSNFAGGFYGQWDSITNKISGITSLDALRAYQNQNRGALGIRGQLSSSAFTRALNKHATDLYRQRLAELGKEQKAKLEANLQAQISDLTSKTEKKETTKTKETKQMTLRFQSSSGQAVSGTFNESDASKMVEILRQAGMITV